MAKPKPKPKPKPKASARKRPAKPRPAVAKPRKPKPKPKVRSKPSPEPAKPKPRAKPSKPPAVQPAGKPRVVDIIDAERPIEALRAFLDAIDGAISVHQGQIALGAAQLMLLSIAHDESDRGVAGREASDVLDLVLARWDEFPERTGFHAQELLRNAVLAVGADRERLAQLAAVVPEDANAELRFELARAFATAGERPAMLRGVAAALAAGVNPEQFARDGEFAAYADDDELRALLETWQPAIPVDIGFHVAMVRLALDSLSGMLRRYGEPVAIAPGASLDAIVAAERKGRIELPNDYRALLTICDGMTLSDHQFFATLDYRTDTALARRARGYLADRSSSECVPLANWGSPNRWLVYDPHGRNRDGDPGVVLMLESDDHVLDGVVAALEHFEAAARDLLATN